MGTSKPKANNSTKSKKTEYTAKGNKIIRFTEVSEKERKELRLDAYKYIL